MHNPTKQLVQMGMMSAVLCVVSPIAIPAGVVPFTLGSFCVYLAGGLLGAKRGTLSVLLYLLLGVLGLPVFSGFSGGFAAIAGPTGGYLIGYLPCAWIVGSGCKKTKKSGRRIKCVLFMTLGTMACYLCGTVWLMLMLKLSFSQALLAGVIPYLLLDCIKVVFAAMMVPVMGKHLNGEYNDKSGI